MNEEIKNVTDLHKHNVEAGNVLPDVKYLAVRLIECFCIALFIFGLLWNTTEVLKLTTPQFMMLYGGGGAAISEVLARLFSKKKIEKEK